MFNINSRENDATRLFRPLANDPVNEIFLCDDKTVGFCFLCQPVSGWDTQMQSTLSLMLSQDSYPTDSMFSFTLWASPDIKDTISASSRMRDNCKNALMRKAHDTALGFLWGGTTHPVETIQQTRTRDFQLLVTFKMPIESLDITEEEREKAISIQRVMEQRLSKSNLWPTRMTSNMLINTMNVMMNWSTDAEWRSKQTIPTDENKILKEQFVEYDTNIIKQNDGVILGSEKNPTYCKMLTVRRFPRKTRFGAAFRWFGDAFDGLGCVTQNFMITVNVAFPAHNGVKSKMETKRNHYIKQTFSALTHFAPKIKDMKADLDELTSSFEAGHKAVKVSISAGVFGRTEREAADGLTGLQSFMKQADMTMVKEESFSLPSFIQMLPFGACTDAVRFSRRYTTMSSKHIIPILPIFAEWKGTGTPTMQFVSRTGQIMNLDLFDSKTNYNTLIYAESGSGKSFLTNEIIRSYLSTNGKVWAIDAGESYKKLSSSFEGQFTEFTDEAHLSCNPFTMIPEDDPKAFDDALEMLAGCILAMAFTKESPSDLQVNEVERILTQVWRQKGQSALIDDVADACIKAGEERDDTRISDIGYQLFAFTTQGQFGKYFDKPHNVEFNGDFNVLELDGLSKRPRLQAVVLFMLMVQISHSMYEEFKQDRSVKRCVIIDEAWDLLGNSKAVEEFMEKGFRRFRKYNGCGIIVTQSINDLQKSDAGKAIAENAAFSLILKQKEATITNAEKNDLMSMPAVGYRLLKKVTTEAGHYSEIFFNTNRGMGIGRLIVDPMRVVMYSTRAKDNAKIDAYTNNGVPLEEAMLNVVRDDNMARFAMPRPAFLNERVKVMETYLDAALLKMPDRKPIDVDQIDNAKPKKVVNG
jgi:conjugal transfer ATP-binding protein TraC